MIMGMLKVFLWFPDLVTTESEVQLMVIDQQKDQEQSGEMSLICDVEFEALALTQSFEAHDNVDQDIEI